jgi:CRP-like cAMP-binding protein
MSQPSQSYVRNCLLSALVAEDYALLRPSLETIELEKELILIEPNRPFHHVVFPERGIGSVITSTPDGQQVETGLFGRDGMSGISVLMGSNQSAHTTIMQVSGDGYRIAVDALLEAIAASRPLHAMLLRYAQAQLTQASYTALSNATQSVEERLARWLLMSHDRVNGDEIALTHEFLSIMLAVRRPSVTTALHVLEGNHFIRAKRGIITVIDRDAMIEFANGSYGVAEAEYTRLVGPFS